MELELQSLARLLQSLNAQSSIHQGKQLHLLFLKKGLINSTISLANRLLQMYTRYGTTMADAHKLFNEMPDRNCFSWNNIIEGYMKFGDKDTALKLFDLMPCKNEFSWNVVFSGFVKACELGVARRLFNEMPRRNGIAWNSMIHGYARNGLAREALKLFKELNSNPLDESCGNTFVLASVIGACADLGAVECGKQIHARIVINDLECDSVLFSSLINLYAKCGDLDSANYALNMMDEVDDFSLSSYALNMMDEVDDFSIHQGKQLHLLFLKKGLINSTISLANRLLQMYTRCGVTMADAHKLFNEMPERNTISWNICLKGMINIGRLETARFLFDEMPERDVVSWNSMISGFASHGYINSALGTFGKMQNKGVRPSEFTYSIMVSLVFDALHGKELHASMIRSKLNMSNVVLGNSLIDMYGRLGGHVDYAFGVFLTMKEVDVITWNSVITGCCKSGHGDLALSQFCLMRSLGFLSDEFTCSAVITSCCNLRNLEKGKQIFAFCLKVGFLCNTIVSSAAIDLFSKCNRLEDSVKLFEELDQRDSALCNSLISSYAGHGFEEKALQLFVDSLRADIRPTEFTISSVLSSISSFPAEQGTQIHSLAVKLGLESDAIVASSLVEMYAKFGLVDYAIDIFKNVMIRDLISWNTMIMGLTHNGRVLEALGTFKELLSSGLLPDRMTVAGILLACSYGGFLDEGLSIFSSMHESYGITPGNEHYSCIVDLLCQTGRIDDAMSIVEAMPYEPDSLIWRSILNACAIQGDLKLTERVAERLMEVEPLLSLPYQVLARIYEMRGQWEAMVRVKRIMETKKVKTVIGCSWIGLKNNVYVFKADQLQHHGGKHIYSLLRLVDWEVEYEGLSLSSEDNDL